MLNIDSFRTSEHVQLKHISGIKFNSTQYYFALVKASLVAVFILFIALAMEQIGVAMLCIVPFALAYDKAKITVKSMGYDDIIIVGTYKNIKHFYKKLKAEMQKSQN